MTIAPVKLLFPESVSPISEPEPLIVSRPLPLIGALPETFHEALMAPDQVQVAASDAPDSPMPNAAAVKPTGIVNARIFLSGRIGSDTKRPVDRRYNEKNGPRAPLHALADRLRLLQVRLAQCGKNRCGDRVHIAHTVHAFVLRRPGSPRFREVGVVAQQHFSLTVINLQAKLDCFFLVIVTLN